MKKIIVVLFFLFCVIEANSQVFYTETFDGSVCAAGSGCDPSFVGWTITNVGVNGVNANKFYVSCQENGNAAGVCGSGCGSDQSLHVGNVSTSSAAFLFCPSGDCGAAYDDSSPDEATNIRCESPTINCTSKSNITIEFNYIESGEGADDNATLWYFDGAAWNNINALSKTSTCGSSQGLWTAFSGSLPASADNNPNVKIAFRWANDGDGAASDPSFAVDDITLSTPIPTPIELVSFIGKGLTPTSNLLEWITSSEINNDFFTLERSTDAIHFEAISTINGAGNSSIVLNYKYVDMLPIENVSTYYYRLKQTDFDGQFEYFDVIAIARKNTNKLNVFYYNKQLHFSDDHTKEFSVTVLDVSGRIIYENKQATTKVNLDFLTQGIYIYQLRTNNTVLSNKIVVQ